MWFPEYFKDLNSVDSNLTVTDTGFSNETILTQLRIYQDTLYISLATLPGTIVGILLVGTGGKILTRNHSGDFARWLDRGKDTFRYNICGHPCILATYSEKSQSMLYSSTHTHLPFWFHPHAYTHLPFWFHSHVYTHT